MWASQFKFFVMYKPRNVTSLLYSISLFCNKMWGLWDSFEWQRWNDIATVLELFIMRLLFKNQISNCFITKESLVCKVSWLLSVIKTFVSSSYNISFVPWIFKGRSLIYIRNRRDPKTEPYGTPYVIVLSEDWSLYWLRQFLSMWDILQTESYLPSLTETIYSPCL